MIRTSVWDLVASRGRVATGLSVLGYWQCNWTRCYHGPCLQAALPLVCHATCAQEALTLCIHKVAGVFPGDTTAHNTL